MENEVWRDLDLAYRAVIRRGLAWAGFAVACGVVLWVVL